MRVWKGVAYSLVCVAKVVGVVGNVKQGVVVSLRASILQVLVACTHVVDTGCRHESDGENVEQLQRSILRRMKEELDDRDSLAFRRFRSELLGEMEQRLIVSDTRLQQ